MIFWVLMAYVGAASAESTELGPASPNSAATSATTGASQDPPTCANREELQALTALRQLRLRLQAREADVAAREKSVKALSEHFTTELTALSAAVTRLEARLGVGSRAPTSRAARVLSLLESLELLSNSKAAPLVAKTDPSLASEVLLRLNAERRAAILALMPVANAARLMEQVVNGPASSVAPAPGVAALSATRQALDNLPPLPHLEVRP